MTRLLLALLLVASPAFASDAALYGGLAKIDRVIGDYEATRTPTGIDFVSKKTITLGNGQSHAKYHIEVEGAMPADGAQSILEVAQLVAAVVKPEVDTTQLKENQFVPGIDAAFVDINGTVVAILDYRANNDDHPYRTRIALLAGDVFYIATMSLHSDDEKDRAILALLGVVTAMINSGEIDGLQSPVKQ